MVVHNVGHTTRYRLASAIDIDSCGHDFLFLILFLNEKEIQVGLSITIIAVHSIEIDLKLAALLHNEWNERVGEQDGGRN